MHIKNGKGELTQQKPRLPHDTLRNLIQRIDIADTAAECDDLEEELEYT